MFVRSFVFGSLEEEEGKKEKEKKDDSLTGPTIESVWKKSSPSSEVSEVPVLLNYEAGWRQQPQVMDP